MWYKCGKCVLKVRCGEGLGLYMSITGVANFRKVSYSDYFPINQGVAYSCTLSPTLFFLFISMVYCKKLRNTQSYMYMYMLNFQKQMSGLLFANDLVRIAETGSALQILIDIVHNYSKR